MLCDIECKKQWTFLLSRFGYYALTPLLYVLSLQIKDVFAEGKDLYVTVMSAMGEEQICAIV